MHRATSTHARKNHGGWTVAMLAAVAAVAGLAMPAAVPATPHEYVEDFTTTTYRDPAATTAQWDTDAGRLTLGGFQPVLIGALDTNGFARAIHVDGPYLYVADQGGGLLVVSVLDPSAPALLGAYNPVNSVYGVAVDGDQAVILEHSAYIVASGVRVVDVTSPTGPTANTEAVWWSGTCQQIVMDGDLGVVAGLGAGVILCNVTNSAAPATIAMCDTPGSANGVVLAGRQVLVADGTGIGVVDISNRSTPTLIGYCAATNAQRIAAHGRYAFVADASVGVLVVDVSVPATPLVVASLPIAGATDVCVDGDWLYVSADVSGVYMFDIRVPTAPILAASIDTPGQAVSCRVEGDRLYVADGGAGLRIYRIAEPVVPPVLVARHELSGGYRAVAVQGDYAFVTVDDLDDPVHTSQMHVLDISDPDQPDQIGSFQVTIPSVIVDVDVRGDLAYLCVDRVLPPHGTHNAFVYTVDVSDPSNPVQVGIRGWAGMTARGMTVRDGYAYVFGQGTSPAHGIWIVDARDPAAPVSAAWVQTLDSDTHGVSIAGNHAYATEHDALDNQHFQVYGITNPVAPVRVWQGLGATTREVHASLIVGNHILVTSSALHIFDLTNPAAPFHLGYVYLGGMLHVARAGHHLVVTNSGAYGGFLQVFDIANPANPIPASAAPQSGFFTDVVAAGDHAFATNVGTIHGIYAGLDVYRIFRRGVDPEANLAQSLTLDTSSWDVYCARLNTVQSGTIDWQMSNDGGVSWHPVVPGADWFFFPSTGSDLRWRAELRPIAGAAPPHCDDLTVQWYHTDIAGAESDQPPTRFALHGGAPNPFNARTTIRFDVPQGGVADLGVFDLTGCRVRRLVVADGRAGRRQAIWDGRNDQGRELPTGTYVCRLQGRGFSAAAKVSLVR